MSQKVLVRLATGAATVVAQVAFPPLPSLAATGAIVTSISRDAVSTQVPVSGVGCHTSSGRPNTAAQLFLRGPGASTSVVFSGPATVQPDGSFSGFVTVPSNAGAGSTYKVSAQCIEQGQAAGVESGGIPLPPPGQGYMSFDREGFPVPPSSSTTVAPTTTAPHTSIGMAATTSRAIPIVRQPQFTG